MSTHILRFCALTLALCAAIACSTLPDRGTDDVVVMVGDASVFRRERFLGDRYEDLQWLRDQLEPKAFAEYEQGLQGASSVTFKSQIGFAAKAVLEATVETALASAVEDAEPGAEVPGSAPAEGSEPDEEPGASEDEESPGTTTVPLDELEGLLQFDQVALGQEILKRLSPSAPISSPRDRLKDRLAVRDEVRSAIRQRSLDDTHDLGGSELYELQFDLSLAAGENPGSAYLVSLTLEKPEGAHAEEEERLSDRDLNSILNAMEQEVVSTAFRFGERIYSNRATTADAELVAQSIRRGSLAARCEIIGDLYGAAKTLALKLDERVNFAQHLINDLDDLKIDTGQLQTASDSLRKRLLAATTAAGLVQESEQAFATTARRFGLLNDAGAIDSLTFLDSILVADDLDNQKALGISRSSQSIKALVETLTEQLARTDSLATHERRLASLKLQHARLTIAESALLDLPPCPACDQGRHRIEDEMHMKAFGAAPFPFERVERSRADGLESFTVTAPFPGGIIPAHPAHAQPQVIQGDAVSALRDGLADLEALPWPRVRSYARRCGQVLAARQTALAFGELVTVVPPMGLGRDDATASLDLIRQSRPTPQVLRAGIEKLILPWQRSRVVGISPKEQAERISTVAQADLTRAFELVAGGQVATSVAAGAEFKNLRRELRRYDMIARNPLIVGFIQAAGFEFGDLESGPTFGWILSPRLETTTAGEAELRYRQLSRHHPVSATMVIPAHWQKLRFRMNVLEICDNGSWLQHDPTVIEASGADRRGVVAVDIPMDPEAIVRGIVYSRDPSAAKPKLTGGQEEDRAGGPWKVRAGASARLVIQGDNVWRAPEVYLGGQKADRVHILPDLNGLSVEFDKIHNLAAQEDEPIPVNLLVSTSRGTDVLWNGVIVYPPKAATQSAKVVAKLAAPAIVARDAAGSKMTPPEVAFDLNFQVTPALPDATSALRLRIRREGVLGDILDETTPPTRVRLSKDRKTLTLVGIRLPLLAHPERLSVDLFHTPGVGKEPVRLTPDSLELVVFRSATTLAMQSPPSKTITSRLDMATGALKVTTPVTLEANGAGIFDMRLLGELVPKLKLSTGHSADIYLGTAHVGKATAHLSGSGTDTKLRITLPAGMPLKNVALKNGKPTVAAPALRIDVGELEVLLGAVTLSVI